MVDPNQPRHLIIHHHSTTKPLPNRWAFGISVTDYLHSIRDWITPLTGNQLEKVIRLKICGLPRIELQRLLNTPLPALEQLDIDTFECTVRDNLRYEFQSLSVLSIEEFKLGVYQFDDGKEVEVKGMATVLVIAPKLQKVYLGKYLKDLYLSLFLCLSVHLSLSLSFCLSLSLSLSFRLSLHWRVSNSSSSTNS